MCFLMIQVMIYTTIKPALLSYTIATTWVRRIAAAIGHALDLPTYTSFRKHIIIAKGNDLNIYIH
jgi:hypothetical protein